MDTDLYDLLFRLWDKNAQYVIANGIHFEVFTPNGPEKPVFVPMNSGDIGTYSEVSLKVEKPGKPPKPDQQKAKVRALPRKLKNTDVS